MTPETTPDRPPTGAAGTPAPQATTFVAIYPGAHVYARYGRYVGIVEAASDGLVRVRSVEPLGRVYYVPTSAIIGALPGGHEIFLRCTRDDLVSQGWLHAPHALPEP